MKNSEIIYELMLEFDRNIEPSTLTLGSLLFDFITKDCSFNMKAYRYEATKYYLYSDENQCEAYRWLKENGFIYYSKSRNRYFVTDMIKDVLDLHNKRKGE
jgi:hypothetical protein